jgi:2',3'-cyclic-nucleotide 2'-phosphodiesterase (5'-nucleotidase family)
MRLDIFLALLLTSRLVELASSFSVSPPARKVKGRGGGSAPTNPDQLETSELWEASPCEPAEARLIILQVTDVYTLENFASFKTLLEETRKNSEGAKVISMLTGDFLSPYLLSSVDRGFGMMHALDRIPMDYLTWGNHEADISHRTGKLSQSRARFPPLLIPNFALLTVIMNYE